MKVGVVGSRGLSINNLEKYMPDNVSEIISGGAIGIDRCAAKYAKENNIKLTEFLPEYDKFYKTAPLRRNITIIEHSDLVLAFWDEKSRGTAFVIKKCIEKNVPVRVYIPKADNTYILKEDE